VAGRGLATAALEFKNFVVGLIVKVPFDAISRLFHIVENTS
jgi:hypothetical protein